MKNITTLEMIQNNNDIFNQLCSNTSEYTGLNEITLKDNYDLFINKDIIATYYDYTHYRDDTLVSRDDLVYIYKDSETFRYSKTKIVKDTYGHDLTGTLVSDIKPSDGYFLIPDITSKTNSKSVYRSYPMPLGGISKQNFNLYYIDSNNTLQKISNYDSLDCHVDYLIGYVYINDDKAIANNIRLLFTSFNTIPVSVKGLKDIDYNKYDEGFYNIVNTMFDKVVTVNTISSDTSRKLLNVSFSKDVVLSTDYKNQIKIEGELLKDYVYVKAGESIHLFAQVIPASDAYSLAPTTVTFNPTSSYDNVINKSIITSSISDLNLSLKIYEKVSNNVYETNPIILNL